MVFSSPPHPISTASCQALAAAVAKGCLAHHTQGVQDCVCVMCRCVLCSGVANCPELGLVMIAALIISSQFLRGVGLPKCLPVIGGWADLLAPHSK